MFKEKYYNVRNKILNIIQIGGRVIDLSDKITIMSLDNPKNIHDYQKQIYLGIKDIVTAGQTGLKIIVGAGNTGTDRERFSGEYGRKN